MFKVQGIDHIGLAIKDVQNTVEWYKELFELDRLYEDVWGNFPGWLELEIRLSRFFQLMI